MTVLCRNCSRMNPPEARYCYWDGAVLDGRGYAQGPIAVGVQPFHSPFVFPSGRSCRNFDELLLAFYAEWKEALELLRAGYLESFFGALARADLALAAKQAARSADLELGLDQLLNKLPCTNREPPKLLVQPMEVNLGILSRGSDRDFVLNIENQGLALLQGTAACEESAWLMLGEGGGSPRKVFQCLHEFKLPVQIHGRALRAGNKPLEGRITLESNGGAALIVVRADVPVRPFPDGVLAGAISPRQIAEKAKANPKEAASYFEKGAVADWYESNGWIYPVQGPPSSGLGAIQQFFEALGLVKAPVVEISETAVHLQAAPGEIVEHVLRVQAQEKRPVFAHATTGAPWLRIGRIRLEGRTARIPLKVPKVPDRPGEQLHGKVKVTANGGQRFLVPVTLAITSPVVPEPDLYPVAEAAPVPSTDPVISVVETVPEAMSVTAPASPATPKNPFDFQESSPVVETEKQDRQRHPTQESELEDENEEIRKKPARGFRKHLVPLGVLVLMLFSVVAHDLWIILYPSASDDVADASLLDPDPYVALRFHDGPKEANLNPGQKDPMPEPSMRFGLVMLREKDPRQPDRLKRLTFDEWGRSNNTVLKVDGQQFLFGQPNPSNSDYGFDTEAPLGEWLQMKSKLKGETAGRPRDGLASAWFLPGSKILVTQEVEIVAGAQSRRLDTCLVRYILDNQDTRSHQVGIRFMLDTFIGANDGVPFTIPGASDLCDTKMRFDTPERVPDFIEALEKDDLRDPGTVAYLQFRVGNNVESPSAVVLGGWPNSALREMDVPQARAQLTGWDVPFISMKENVPVEDKETGEKEIQPAKDSAVTMYWNEQPLQPGRSRTVGFTYGLGNVDTRESGGHLLLTVGGRLVRHGEFTLTALVHDPQPGEKLTLNLPPGFSLVEGGREQTVPPVPPGAKHHASPVTWRLRAGDDGKHELAVHSTSGAKQKLPLIIRTRGVFD